MKWAERVLFTFLGASVAAAAMVVPAPLALAQTPPPAQQPSPAPAAPSLPDLSQSVTDSKGRFTMNFPSDWEVSITPDGNVAMSALGPFYVGSRPSVNVVVLPLLQPMSPEVLAAATEAVSKVLLHNYRSFDNRTAVIQGRPVYSRYFTWETSTGIGLYTVQVFLSEGHTGFVITGGTLNDPDRILHDMPVISRIIETFRIGEVPTGN